MESLDSRKRIEIIDALYRRYGAGGGGNRLRYYRKKLLWQIAVGGAKLLKRSVDVAASACGLICLFPLFLVVAAAIKITDGGPVLYWQTRVGKWGEEFPFPKFRSMVVDADKIKDAVMDQSHHENSITFKMKKDPRVTFIGSVIRKLSIDELPQLWCVLKGDMTLVGPRPAVVREVALYTLTDRRRLDAAPGLTSLWAIKGRGDIPFQEQVVMDVEYIESQSVWMDLKIILKTVPAVLFGRGAY